MREPLLLRRSEQRPRETRLLRGDEVSPPLWLQAVASSHVSGLGQRRSDRWGSSAPQGATSGGDQSLCSAVLVSRQSCEPLLEVYLADNVNAWFTFPSKHPVHAKPLLAGNVNAWFTLPLTLHTAAALPSPRAASPRVSEAFCEVFCDLLNLTWWQTDGPCAGGGSRPVAYTDKVCVWRV